MSIKIHTCLLDRFVQGFQKKMLKERMAQSLEQRKRSLVDADWWSCSPVLATSPGRAAYSLTRVLLRNRGGCLARRTGCW